MPKVEAGWEIKIQHIFYLMTTGTGTMDRNTSVNLLMISTQVNVKCRSVSFFWMKNKIVPGRQNKQVLKLCELLTCMTDDQVGLLHILWNRVFESKGLQIDVWEALGIRKKGPFSNLKNQTLIPTVL